MDSPLLCLENIHCNILVTYYSVLEDLVAFLTFQMVWRQQLGMDIFLGTQKLVIDIWMFPSLLLYVYPVCGFVIGFLYPINVASY